MEQILKTALAEQDLINIWLYSFQQWGEEQANQYLNELGHAIELLGATPLMCTERQEFIPPVRIYHHARHLIIYVITEKAIEIIRVLHESMDINTQLE